MPDKEDETILDSDNIYDEEELMALLQDDELLPREEAFMRGYLDMTEI